MVHEDVAFNGMTVSEKQGCISGGILQRRNRDVKTSQGDLKELEEKK